MQLKICNRGRCRKMKRIGLFLVGILLLLTSCAPEPKEEIVQNPNETSEQEVSIVPSYQLSNDNYKMLLPFRPSEARGVVVNQLRNRLDIEEKIGRASCRERV